jgi:hypothetical protein
MQFPVVDSRLHFVDDGKLHRIHAIDEVLEALVSVRVSTGDVRCIPVHLGAGID